VKVLIGLFVAFLIGAGCRFFDIPVPSPPVLPGALLVVAMTLGYTSTDRLLSGARHAATTNLMCGGPTGQSISGPATNLTLASSSHAGEALSGGSHAK
jgi:XapX domain-containing protein